jgi:intracellular sulfur oxidation DsrE/DsrF family protein
MANFQLNEPTDRRRFLGSIAATAAAAGIATLGPLTAHAEEKRFEEGDPEKWFEQIQGKHRIVYDVTEPHGIFPFAWPRVFLLTNMATGTPEKENSVVVVLRHFAVPFALADDVWAKYNLGETYKITDGKTGKPALRNPFWKPQKGDFKVPGIGEVNIGINELQESGVMFCVCNMAITVLSATAAEKMGISAEDAKKEWLAALLPGIQVVPSGVWAVGRAQEHGCKYCFVG